MLSACHASTGRPNNSSKISNFKKLISYDFSIPLFFLRKKMFFNYLIGRPLAASYFPHGDFTKRQIYSKRKHIWPSRPPFLSFVWWGRIKITLFILFYSYIVYSIQTYSILYYFILFYLMISYHIWFFFIIFGFILVIIHT